MYYSKKKDRNMLTLREKRHLDKTLICKYNLMYHFLFKEQTYKNKQKERIRVTTCLRNRTTLRFDILHSSFFVYGLCANLCFLIHRILKFQDSQLHMRINTKPNGKQKLSEDCRKMTFLLISHQTTLVLEKYRFAHRL